MVKATEFWKCLCCDLGYRFFAGVPCAALTPLYNKMSSDFLHYVPAVNEQVAAGLSNGAFIAGLNSAILIAAEKIEKIDLSLNERNNIPLLIIAGAKEEYKFKKGVYSLRLTDDFADCLQKITKHIISKKSVGVLIVTEGFLQ